LSLRKSTSGGRTRFFVYPGGKSVYLGSNPAEAEKRFREEFADRVTETFVDNTLGTRGGKPVMDTRRVVRWLASAGLAFTAFARAGAKHPYIRGAYGYGVVLTVASLDSVESLPWAVGCVHLLRALVGSPTDRLVVVCYPEDGPAASIELARKLGVEFLTPDELVASLKGSEGPERA
jgi:hypothetical protein